MALLPGISLAMLGRRPATSPPAEAGPSPAPAPAKAPPPPNFELPPKGAGAQARAERETHARYLVDCILAGQTDKFNELAELYHAQIYAVAWRYCGHREDALDITQNVLIRLYRALPSWGGQSRFSTWLHRITMNAAIDYHRRHARHDHQRIDPEEANVGEEARITSDPFMGITYETPKHQRARREVRRAVMAALPELSEMQRRCFILRHFHDMPVAEVAEAAGCSEGSVKRHLFRAAARLRELLAHLEPMLEDDTLSSFEEGRE
jgi:RNA polymerase sigma-70 factor (ECF subfamily)